ncbi:hypothetical protein AK812_SmicGene40128 [Symbiodinium microadriaticum]|uniref:Uncharacterized protein n=1 Tax=Symbiodinium microadriaticum TaxID=2951 RepID=A0A1Q9C9H8_SYMMI|nr:hypothetical protein AK812_SmicGene40128 [Symbiodinium microadriaticum]
MDTAKKRKLRFFVACSLGFLSLCLRTRSPLVFSQTLPARVVSHTKMQVHSPWSKEFEANWQVPPEALSGSLLRHDGNYVAALEWASQADCDAWLGQPGMEQTRQSTVQYVVCGAVPSASSELDDKTSAGSAPQKAFARDLMDNALGGGIRSRADFEALQAPEVDPSVLFAISAGDDVDIEESDEVLISGGDPSFLNDDKWSSSSQVAEKQQKTQLDLAHTTEAEDEDDEEDVLFHGGDPTFLDDTLWGDQADKKVEVAEPCAQFGNVSYLVAEDYDAWHRQAVAKAPRLDLKELKAQNGKPFKKLPKVLHVVPYVHEEFLQYAEAAGLSPRNTKGSIPADVRSEHYGTVVGRIVSQQVPLLMVDKRSQLGLLRPEEQLRFNVNFEVVPGSQGKSCVEVCQSRNAKCDKQQIYFLNDCNLLKKHFPCEAGCAHQVGKELPVYVPDPAQSTKGQCLITFISPATCEAKHKSTSRLCPCSVAAKADAVRPAFVTVHGSRVRTKKNIWLCHAESHAAKILAETCISRSACRHCRYQVGSVAHRSCRVRANTRHSEKPCIASQSRGRAGACRRSEHGNCHQKDGGGNFCDGLILGSTGPI